MALGSRQVTISWPSVGNFQNMKRFNNFEAENACPSKKFKSIDVDHFWSDDDELEDCLLQATQIAEKQEEIISSQVNNVTLHGTYSAWQRSTDVFSSTRIADNNFCIPKPPKTVQQIENELQEVKAKLQNREGEASILRDKLKQTTENLNSAHTKKQNELAEKLKVVQKEVDKVHTELEFKNFEIVNLKRKLVDCARNSMDVAIKNSAEKVVLASIQEEKEVKQLGTILDGLIIEPISVEENPLNRLIPDGIFNQAKAENCSLLNTLRQSLRDDAASLQSFVSAERLKTISKLETLKSKVRLRDIYPEIKRLSSCSRMELNCKSMNRHYDKIIHVFVQLLDNLQRHLNNIKSCVPKESLQMMDLVYLNFIQHDAGCYSILDTKELCDNECGVECRILLGLLALILPYSQYVKNEVLRDSSSKNLLNVLLDTINVIGKIRLTTNYAGFLIAVCVLMVNVYKYNEDISAELADVLKKLTKSIILTRPSVLVLHHFTELLAEGARHNSFVQSLCDLQKGNGSLKVNSKKGIALVNDDCCIFQMFSLLWGDPFLDREKTVDARKLQRDINLMRFIGNVCNVPLTWLHIQENQHNDCAVKFCKFGIKVMYDSQKDAEHVMKRKDLAKYIEVSLRMSSELIHTLYCKFKDLICEDINLYASYRTILLQVQNYARLGIVELNHYEVEAAETITNTPCQSSEQCDANELDSFPLWTDC